MKIQWHHFTDDKAVRKIAASNAVVLTVPPAGGGISLEGTPGHLGGVSWKSTDYVILDALNHNDWVVEVVFGFWRLDSNRPDVTVTMGLLPGLVTRLVFPLAALNSQQVLLQRTPGRLKTVVSGSSISIEQVNRFTIRFTPSAVEQKITLFTLEITEEEPKCLVPNQQVVDRFGQWMGKEWPGKTHSQTELVDLAKKELAHSDPKGFPVLWSRCGGWRERIFEATGYFRTTYDGTRWWLVDPYGFAFYSVGVDCVRPGEYEYVKGMEKLFAWLPSPSGKFAPAWQKNQLSLQPEYFNFGIANLIRAFGSHWWDSWARITRARLKHWTFNTVGSWSSLRFAQWAQLPYVLLMENFPETKKKIFRDFPDVFSDEYQQNARNFAKQLDGLQSDGNMIGYFLGNEPQWAFSGCPNLGIELLVQEEVFASKDELIRFLAKRYDGDVQRLNAQWRVELSEFNDLRQPISRDILQSGQAAKDLADFTTLMLEHYISVPCEAVKEVDPCHLNLGIRWKGLCSEILLTATRFIDVVSFNCHQIDPSDQIERAGKMTGLPVLIGEYQFGALDRGLLATGLQGVPNQRERGKAYRYYVERAASVPWCVGTHYFMFNDQPVLGGGDGENYQVGLVDVCQKPYDEVVKEVKAANASIYEIISGRRTPTSIRPQEIQSIRF